MQKLQHANTEATDRAELTNVVMDKWMVHSWLDNDKLLFTTNGSNSRYNNNIFN